MVSRQLPRSAVNQAKSAGVAEEVTLRPEVVAKIAGMAARDVPGVTLGSMPGIMPLMLGAAPESVAGIRRAVRARLDGTRATVDLWLKVTYGPPIAEVVTQVRQAVRRRLGEMAAVHDVHINVHITDMTLPAEDEPGAKG